MAAGIVVPGACPIYVDTGAANALELLGYSINGVEIFEEARFLDVPGDQNGGDDGPPIDIQILGKVDRVRMELSKWDSAVAAKIQPFVYGGTAGTVPTPGTLMYGGSKTFRLVLASPVIPRNYPTAIPRPAIESQRGTKFARLVIEWECHNFSGTLYNSTTT